MLFQTRYSSRQCTLSYSFKQGDGGSRHFPEFEPAVERRLEFSVLDLKFMLRFGCAWYGQV